LIDGKSEFSRQESLYQYAASLGAAAMPGAINEAMQLPLQYRNDALTVLFSRWAELDPEAAAKYANLMPKSAKPGTLRRVGDDSVGGERFHRSARVGKGTGER
jgi:hypothetical protein